MNESKKTLKRQSKKQLTPQEIQVKQLKLGLIGQTNKYIDAIDKSIPKATSVQQKQSLQMQKNYFLTIKTLLDD